MAKRGGGKPKHVKVDQGISPKGTKQPRASVDSSENLPPTWQFGIVDVDGPWSWAAVDWAEIKEKLGKLETTTWADIRRATRGSGKSNSHWVEIDDLTAEAKQRLRRIGQIDAPALYSLRLSGRHRVWGIKDQQCLRLLWWDPDHEVCDP